MTNHGPRKKVTKRSIKEKVSDFRNFILAVISAVALLSRTFLVFMGLDARLSTIVYVLFALWPAYLFYIKSRPDDLATTFLQSSRAATYGISFLLLVPINSLVVTPAQPFSILLTPAVGLVLAAMVGVTLAHFSEEIRMFDVRQRNEYKEMIAGAGAACIWITVAIGFLNLVIFEGSLAASMGVALIVSIVNGGVAVWKDYGSVRHMKLLAESLSSTGWPLKVQRSRKSEILRARRKSLGSI
jgi:hypothetical protein